jgi:hypothetical protein
MSADGKPSPDGTPAVARVSEPRRLAVRPPLIAFALTGRVAVRRQANRNPIVKLASLPTVALERLPIRQTAQE